MIRIQAKLPFYLQWWVVFLASLTPLKCEQACVEEITVPLNISINEEVLASTLDFPQPPSNCTSSLIWEVSTDANTTTHPWISIKILDFVAPPDEPEMFTVGFSLARGEDDEWLALSPQVESRIFVEVEEELSLRVRYSFPGDEEHLNGSYIFQARLIMTNETDCHGDVFCKEETHRECYHPAAVCDRKLDCRHQWTDETNCEDTCGQTDINIDLDQPFHLENPKIDEVFRYICTWMVHVPASTNILIRFSSFVLSSNVAFVIAEQEFSFAERKGEEHVVFSSVFHSYASIPKALTLRDTSAVWIFYLQTTAVTGVMFFDDSTFSLRVHAVNGTHTVECPEGEFLCGTGIDCIDESYRCDGLPNCEDFSDEFGCRDSCPGMSCVRYSGEVCADRKEVCDSRRLCDDFRDEIGCASSCGDLHVRLNPDQTHQLTSPFYPSAYPVKIVCVWLITAPAPPANRILVQTVSMQLSAGAELSVGEGARVDPARLMWRRQGGTAPLLTVSWGHEVWVTLEDTNRSPLSSQHGVPEAHFVLEFDVLELAVQVNCSGDDEVACDSGLQCISASEVCDGALHCFDNSDEYACGQCEDSASSCIRERLEVCVTEDNICNGDAACDNHLDEMPCANVCGERFINLEEYPDSPYDISFMEGFPPGTDCLWVFRTTPGERILVEVKHQTIGRDVDEIYMGDGAHPHDQSAEVEYITDVSYPHAFLSSTNLVWMSFFSSHSADSGGSFWYQFSTYHYQASCGEAEFRCVSNGLCTEAEQRCDGAAWCQDFSDEFECEQCSGISTINTTNGLPYVVEWSFYGDTQTFPNGQFCSWRIAATVGSRLRVTTTDLHISYDMSALVFGQGEVIGEEGVLVGFSGSYARRTFTLSTFDLWLGIYALESTDRFAIEIQQYEPEHADCSEDQFPCPLEDSCIPQDQVCDGIPQCPLQGDELSCEFCAHDSDAYRCPDGNCISWLFEICDGKAHCKDLSDERNCYPCGHSDLLLSNSTTTSLTLQSINYPLPYPNDALCVWVVTADTDRAVVLRFMHFDLQRGNDYLTVGGGHDPSVDSSQIARLSSVLHGVRVISRGRKIWLTFQSDDKITGTGFSGTISQEMLGGSCSHGEFVCEQQSVGLTCLNTAVVCDGFENCLDGSDEQNCGVCGASDIYVDDVTITLQSPAYPGNYPSDVRCRWQVIPEPGESYVMRFLDFAMEDRYDYLYVSQGGDGSEGLSAAPSLADRVFALNGQGIAQRTMVWSQSVYLTMETDNSKEFRGFSIEIERLNVTDLRGLCEDGEFHCGNGFCIKQAATCDGYLDCLNNIDESNCSEIFCPGSYKCDYVEPPDTTTSLPTSIQPMTTWPTTNQPITQADGYIQAQCIPRALVCNGVQDCPNLDDETECDIKRCPIGCDCHYSLDGNFVVSCGNGWNATTLTNIAVTTYTLHLSGVDTNLEGGIFKELSNLKVLSLKNSEINEIPKHTFDGLDSLVWLDLSNTSLTELQTLAMEELSGLQGITIFDVPLRRIKTNAFAGLGNVETLILVRNDGNLPPLEVEDLAFGGLGKVSLLYVDNHRLCCFFPDNVECKTLEPEPVLFMCSELMPRVVLKVFMWILGVSAFIGNIFVMVWRCREKTQGKASRVVHSFLVFNLAVSDALMGLYMLIIAGADLYYGRRYFEVSDEWRASVPCQIASVISIVASEASVFFLTLISIDRFIAIVFPFSTHRIRPKGARIITACIWIGTLLVALVPTILATDEQSDVYGLSDVCIGLPLRTKVMEYETRQQIIQARGISDLTVGIPVPVGTRASWFYSIALFLGVNLLCFCVILVCYVAIFVSVSRTAKRVRRHKGQDDEVKMALKMAAIVSTDFICWIPVIIMGILAQIRVVEIPTEAYAWIVVFILPINSSLNPYLYTISDLCSRKRREAAASRKTRTTSMDAKSITTESVA